MARFSGADNPAEAEFLQTDNVVLSQECLRVFPLHRWDPRDTLRIELDEPVGELDDGFCYAIFRLLVPLGTIVIIDVALQNAVAWIRTVDT